MGRQDGSERRDIVLWRRRPGWDDDLQPDQERGHAAQARPARGHVRRAQEEQRTGSQERGRASVGHRRRRSRSDVHHQGELDRQRRDPDDPRRHGARGEGLPRHGDLEPGRVLLRRREPVRRRDGRWSEAVGRTAHDDQGLSVRDAAYEVLDDSRDRGAIQHDARRRSRALHGRGRRAGCTRDVLGPRRGRRGVSSPAARAP